tara:strand:+ start:326 stop:2275 length:1950 start_codon:yes stop_codon:yes gene_type:complete
MAEEFVKIRNGVKAPSGFHYMTSGRLMSDYDHIQRYGYINKSITNFEVDTSDISCFGETKSFTISGDKGAVFSLEIYDDDTTRNYYNFNTNTWSTSKSGLYNIEINGDYSGSISFPILGFVDTTCDYNNDPTIDHDDDDGAIQAGMSVSGTGIPTGSTVSSVTSDTRFELSASTTGGAVVNGSLRFSKLKTYTVELKAVTVNNIQTQHQPFVEVKNPDNTINLNLSTGSNSSILTKKLYQDVKKYLYITGITPVDNTSSTGTVDGATSTVRIVLDQDATNPSTVKIGDHISGTGVDDSVGMAVTKINPDGDNVKEIEVNVADSISDAVTLTFDPVFKGSTFSTDTIEISSGKNITTNFSITCTATTGRTLSIVKTPTVEDLCAYKTMTFGSAAIAISGEDTSSSTYYRWPVENIVGLSQGMILDPERAGGGTNTVTPAFISGFQSTIASTELDNRKYYTDIITTSLEDVNVSGVDTYNNAVSTIDRHGNVTLQAGNLTFNVQQPDALKDDNNVKIYAYGKKQIETMTGMIVELSNVVVTPTQISTTTTAAVNNSTTIPVTETGKISTASTIRGVNINPAVANPTVTLKSTFTGAGNLTASSAQTLENGQTLFFDGASNVVTVTGTISIQNMAIDDTTLYLDVERFLIGV